jgi:hypothetical protein
MSQVLLQISGIANGDSTSKENDVLQLLIAAATNELVGLYITAITKQQSLPVKQILLRYIQHVEKNVSSGQKQELYELLINLFTPPTALVSAPLTQVVLNLASLYEQQQSYGRAIEILHVLQTDVIAQDFVDELSLNIFRVELNTRIAKDCLEIDDFENAEAHLTRISLLLSLLPSSATQLVIDAHKTSVQVMVRVGKWLEAASRLLLLDDPTCDCFTVSYAILARTTPFKKNLFTKISKVEHIMDNILDTPLKVVFERMFEGRLIYKGEFSKLLSFLIDNGERVLPNAYWIEQLSRAVVENNVIAYSTIFANITISTVTEMLGLEQSVVERLITDMIRSDRVEACVDDITKTVQFSSSDPLEEWQEHIVTSCTLLDKIVDDITFPHHEEIES